MVAAIPLFILFGCAPHAETVKQGIYNNPVSGSYIKNVSFFPQTRYYCGPASVASIMNFYGLSVTEEEIAREIYITKLNGTLPMDILRYARTKGFDGSYYKGSMDDMKKHIARGKPVIMFVDLGYFAYPLRHYIVTTGYNDEMGYLIAHSGKDKDKVFSYKEIQTAWEKTGFGTILIVPEGK